MSKNTSSLKEIRNYKFIIYPNKEQERKLTNWLETCRIIYNSAIADRRNYYDRNGKGLTRTQQQVTLKADKAKHPRVKGMVKNHNLAKSIADAGWGEFILMLSYKAESAGRTIEKVNPHGTTQECSRCGAIVKKDLSIRIHICPHCSLVIGRDHNAAINILNKAS